MAEGNLKSPTIATAVKEQSATTEEIARNVTEAARGAATISENIKGVVDAAQSTSTSVGDAQTATEHLARVLNRLRDLVGGFKVDAVGAKQESHAPEGKTAARAAGAR
jgi:methyl-accepting chemotaxis protein